MFFILYLLLMEELCVTFDENFYTLLFEKRKFIYNHNILYVMNLEKPNDFKRIKKINDLDNYTKYIVFTNNFRGNTNIFDVLKKKFNLEFIDFSLECFWILYVNDTLTDESIDIGTDVFNLKLGNLKKNTNEILINEVTDIKNDIEQYKKNVLEDSVTKLYKSYRLIENNIILYKNYLEKKIIIFL